MSYLFYTLFIYCIFNNNQADAKMDIKQKVRQMTLEEKIGQKIILDFRYWDSDGEGQKEMVVPNETVSKIIHDHHIGGIILFANNLKEKDQIKKLTAWYAAMKTRGDIPLLIGTDQEGGNVFRLPRDKYASFPGNMALAAAIAGGMDAAVAYKQGRQMASDMLSMDMNTNFAPVVDVNSNPLNPVINVRAFSDDADMVSFLAEKVTTGMREQGLITTYKHFPGHGNTSTDSHTSLPCVDRSKAEAFAIDIAPYKYAIDHHVAPDMIMTAHIQYPSLDNSTVPNLKGEEIIVPATMSRTIQQVILRHQLNFSGVTISDALNMDAIAKNFTPYDAIERVFTAGVDIALMPISISSPSQANRLSELVNLVADKIRKGIISESEVNASVERILYLKQRYNLWGNNKKNLLQASCYDKKLEKQIADRSITVVVNKHVTLPLKNKTDRYFILTPWETQAKGIAAIMKKEGYQNVVAAKALKSTDASIKLQIEACDVFIFGTLSNQFSPVEKDRAPSMNASDTITSNDYLSWLGYAAKLGKKSIHLSLRAPYDIVTYAQDVDGAIAVYSYCGYENGIASSVQSLGEILVGKLTPKGKLPVNIWYDYDVQTNKGTVAFPRGFGLTW